MRRPGAQVLMLALVLGACSSAESRSPAQPGTLALTNVTVIDGTGAAPVPGQTVVIEGRRITAVFPSGSRTPPAGARVLDLAGHYVIPGLIDAHVHLASFDRGEIYPVLLRHTLLGGVTTVRDMGGNARVVGELSRRARADDAESPRIYYSAVVAGPEWFGRYDPERVRFWSYGHTPGTAPGLRLLADTTDIEALVAEAVRIGATGLKVFTDVPTARLAALTAAAHARGLRVWSHAVVPPSRPEAVAGAGVDVVSHADMLIWSSAGANDSLVNRGVRSRLLRSVAPGSPAQVELLREMRERGTLLEPTLLVMAMGNAERGRAVAGADTIVAWAARMTAEAHRQGVPIVVGTDAIGTYTPNVHTELQLLVDWVGMTPREALRAATEHGARALGAQDSLGTVAVGKLADLVVLRADPSRDIRNTQTVAYVVRGGVVHRREEGWRPPPLSEPPPGR